MTLSMSVSELVLSEGLFVKLSRAVETAVLLLRTRTPLSVWRGMVGRMLATTGNRSQGEANYIADRAKALRLSQDWFSPSIPRWRKLFKRTGLDTEGSLQLLEIGSFEGNSSTFLLDTFGHSILTCVDTWGGLNKQEAVVYEKMRVEESFDLNTARYRDRLIKFKGTSEAFFAQIDVSKATYDLIYVDGSHYFDDVLIDAIRCFSMLKVGGLMIIDDYLWTGFKRMEANPIIAVNTFIRVKKRYLRVVEAGPQLMILKLASEDYAGFEAFTAGWTLDTPTKTP
jgi:predicted O-methyltransferase YrrM